MTLFVVGLVGAISMVSLGLVVSARVTSEELAGGLLNLINWPMMMFPASGSLSRGPARLCSGFRRSFRSRTYSNQRAPSSLTARRLPM